MSKPSKQLKKSAKPVKVATPKKKQSEVITKKLTKNDEFSYGNKKLNKIADSLIRMNKSMEDTLFGCKEALSKLKEENAIVIL